MNSLGNSSTSTTMSAKQKRRPLHLISEIETMMNQKSQQDSNSGNRISLGGGVDDEASYSSRTAAAVLSPNASSGSGGDVRRPRQRRFNKRGGNDSSVGDCSATSASSLSFLHSHGGVSSASVPLVRFGGDRAASGLKKNSVVYGGLFVLCGIMSYAVVWMEGLTYHHHYSYDYLAAATSDHQQQQQHSNRQLSFLDSIWSDYGKDSFHFEYLLPPSELDLTVSRRLPVHLHVAPDDTVTPDDGLCDDILLFLPDSFARNGHGSQLNSYILAAEVATFLNKSLVVYDSPQGVQGVQKFKGGSQFGCPTDSLVGGENHVLMREQKEGEQLKGGTRGWVENFPRGLERLIQHPDWLSRKCAIPCQDDFKYSDWENVRTKQQAPFTDPETGRKDWNFDIQEVKCKSSHGRDTNVLVVGGYELRKYFDQEIKDRMIHRVPSSPIDSAINSANGDGNQNDKNNNKDAYDWAIRLGASEAEANAFSDLDQEEDIWDFVSALMARSGVIRFQPWIARDVENFIKNAGLPLNIDYDSIHVRRGDKLIQESKREVHNFWRSRGYGEGTGRKIPRDFIPFSHYVGQGYHKKPCNADGEAHLIYVATDDPKMVKQELSFMKKDDQGHIMMNDCHKFNFLFGPMPKDDILSSHLNAEGGNKNCVDRYKRNIAGIADLLILAKSNLFIGEFNSNWGRLVRVFRMRLNDELFMSNGEVEGEDEQLLGGKRRRTAKTVAHPVLTKGLKVAWGKPHPGPLGL